jgi:hypothetical protein
VCILLRPLGETEHYDLRLDSRCRLFFARRTRLPFADAAAIEQCFDAIAKLLSEIDRSAYHLLVDVRSGPARNDPSFETLIANQRGKLLLGFRRNAALAATAAGRLQIQRYARIDGRDVFTSDDPKAAFEYLGLPYHDLGEL